MYKALTLGVDWGNPYIFKTAPLLRTVILMARFLWVRHKRVIPVPVPQLQPLDARDIIKHRAMLEAVARACEYPCEGMKRCYPGYYPWIDDLPRPPHSPRACDGLLPSQSKLLPKAAPHPPLPEVPDMIVFSDDESDCEDD